MTIEMADSESAKGLNVERLAPLAVIHIAMKNPDEQAVYLARLVFSAALVKVEFHNW